MPLISRYHRFLCSHIRNTHLEFVRGHKNFGHKNVPTPLLTKLWGSFLGIGLSLPLVPWERIRDAYYPDWEYDANTGIPEYQPCLKVTSVDGGYLRDKKLRESLLESKQ